MPRPRLLRVLIFALSTVLAGGTALAQSSACARYRAELAAIDSGAVRPVSPAAERLRVEIGRMTNYYRSIGCEGGPLSVFGVSAPPECPSIAQRLRALQVSYDRAMTEGDPSGVDLQERRQQLLAAIQQTCAVQDARPGGPGNFLERLFGGVFRRPADGRPDGRPDGPEQDAAPALGGRRLVCVRTCDGYFFPLSTVPGGRERADEMCRALCPGTEAQAFAMPEGDQALDRAVSLATGRPYTQLPSAFKYVKSFDASCACKREGETWATALQKAEEMLDHRGDLVVTAQKADELSRPKQAPPTRERDRKGAAKAANDAADAVDTGAAAPTASRESSGIGPQSIEGNRIVARTEGSTREVVDSSGQKRTVRVIGPNVTPVPEAR